MKKFRVCVTWHMAGEYNVDANSLEEAIEKVYDAESPYDELPKGEYIDDSFQVDQDYCEELT